MKGNNQKYALTKKNFLFECFNMCWHKLLYSNVSLMQHCTELLKKKCVVTLLLDNIRSLWIGFLNRFNEPNCPKRTGLRKLIGLGIVGITCQICILLNGQTQGLPAEHRPEHHTRSTVFCPTVHHGIIIYSCTRDVKENGTHLTR